MAFLPRPKISGFSGASTTAARADQVVNLVLHTVDHRSASLMPAAFDDPATVLLDEDDAFRLRPVHLYADQLMLLELENARALDHIGCKTAGR